ncbi:Uncharacterised protein [Halioglobus japonicus]|nr:Uncharacterised protein [Halioglobus japonicus]
MEERYNIYFAGQVMDGFDVNDVRSKLAKLFNANQATLDKLFGGKRQLIKRECDKATAVKYKKALEQAGAVPVIQRAQASAPAAAPASPPSAVRTMTAAEKIAALAAAPDETHYQQRSAAPAPKAEQSDTAADASGIILAPPGTEVLRESERAAPVVREVDTSGLTIDATAERLSEKAPPPPAAPDTGHLSMGEVGDTIPTLDSSETPLSPNLDGLALSAEGTDFSDCAAPEPSAPPLDLSHLSALPPGDASDDEQSRKPPPAASPDTTHISLKD